MFDPKAFSITAFAPGAWAGIVEETPAARWGGSVDHGLRARKAREERLAKLRRDDEVLVHTIRTFLERL